MEHALTTMLDMQHRMNTRIHPDWIAQDFAWYRALWIECGELLEHYGYKWWKAQQSDMPQVRLEVVDIWHFGLSALFRPGLSSAAIAEAVVLELEDFRPAGFGVREATEALALHALQTRGFSPSCFWELLHAVEMDFESLYTAYVGKNVLNFFRQDHGYQSGGYQKRWQGREDNEHLVDVVAGLDPSAGDFAEQVYAGLAARYPGQASA